MTAPYIAELVAQSKACLDIVQLWALRVSLESRSLADGLCDPICSVIVRH
jgi:hypothetical protein